MSVTNVLTMSAALAILTNLPTVWVNKDGRVSLVQEVPAHKVVTLSTNWLSWDGKEVGILVSNIFAEVHWKGNTNLVLLEKTPVGVVGVREAQSITVGGYIITNTYLQPFDMDSPHWVFPTNYWKPGHNLFLER